MFLRGNLAAHGIGNCDHRHGTTYWLRETPQITEVVACTNGGYLMCQAPDADAAFWQSAAAALAGRRIAGITGVPDQVNAWAAALGLNRAAFSVKETEPLYRLQLDRLRLPDLALCELRCPHKADAAFLPDWFVGYAQDTGMIPTGGESADTAAAHFMNHKGARVLQRGGLPIAMTSLNAQVADIVQVGGVYVPPHLRGQGLGGAVVAAQLMQLREEGVKTAILFAANATAARVYERIGFDQVGTYEVALLKEPLQIGEVGDVFQT